THAQARFERARRVVDAGVNDFGIARAGVSADALCRFEDDDLVAVARQSPRHGEANHSGADDDTVDALRPMGRRYNCASEFIAVLGDSEAKALIVCASLHRKRVILPDRTATPSPSRSAAPVTYALLSFGSLRIGGDTRTAIVVSSRERRLRIRA